jgi:glyoxalase superfamily protein
MGNASARFKELCLDTSGDGREVGEFWAAATGCEYTRTDHPDDPGDVVGTEEGMGIAICRVPEPKTVKNRVHLDLHTVSVAALEALGATVASEQHDEDPWTVMLDPEGNELCGFVREPERVPAYKVYELVVDSADHESIGQWWADVFGVELKHQDGKDWSWLEGVPGMPFEAWVFGAVTEPKTVKNRMHWDVYGDVADFEARGATRLWRMPRWTVLADPEGNEFCVFPEG